MSNKRILVVTQRVAEVEVGDIIRSPRDGGHLPFPAWARVTSVEVADIVTKVTVLRPGTTDGVITDRRGDRVTDLDPSLVRVVEAGIVVPSWELVQVQSEIDQYGVSRRG